MLKLKFSIRRNIPNQREVKSARPTNSTIWTHAKSVSPATTITSIQNSRRFIILPYMAEFTHRHKYDMRFYEFATIKPKKPSKPLTPEQSVVAARKRDVDQAKQALDRTKNQQKRRGEIERSIKGSYIFKLQNR